MAELGDEVGMPGVKRVDIGWGKVKDGRYILFLRPIPEIPMGPFALVEQEARELYSRFGQMLDDMEKHRKAS